jgi:thiol-disulfide isomerase/thioredoxin
LVILIVLKLKAMQKITICAVALGLSLAVLSCKGDAQATPEAADSLQSKDTTAKTTVKVTPEPAEVFTNDTVTVNGYKWEGLSHYLNQKNDTTYVVNFWATWCQPCVEELPHFEQINKKYKDNKVKVLLVSLDFGKDISTRLLPFINRKQLKSDIIVMRETDADSWIPKVDSTWTGALPATVIYNKDMRKFYEKQFTYAELEKEISKFK